MKTYSKQPEIKSDTAQPKASKQASAHDVLQAYKAKIVQRQEIDEDELLQGKFETAQREGIDEDELLQGKFDASFIVQKEEATQPPTENRTGLADNWKSGIESLSGYSMDDVRVHYNSSKPAQLQALAYAQGTDIHVAPGQEQHLPHEAWHVVQQKQGRVQPTMQLQGVNVNDNEGLEKEADVMGGKALQMKRNKDVIQCLNPSDLSTSIYNTEIANHVHPITLGQHNDANNTANLILNLFNTTNPDEHPETEDFLYLMTTIGVPFADAYEIWQYLLLGLQDQDFYNQASLYQEQFQGERQNFGYRSNDDLRNENEMFALVAQMVRPYLDVGDNIGLWSGGFDLSQYAANIGCITLEESPFGFILDSLYLTNSWGRLGPLWNIISKTFVDVAINNNADFHVFLRVYDIGSVLLRQEVNQIRRFGPLLNIFWHPIVNEGADYLELDADCNLSEDHQLCTESECLSRLIIYFQATYPFGRGAEATIVRLMEQLDFTSVDEVMDHLAAIQQYPNIQ